MGAGSKSMSPEDKEQRKRYVGDPNLPEDDNNHEIGKWCYALGRHCEDAASKYPEDCILCLLESLKKEGKVGR